MVDGEEKGGKRFNPNVHPIAQGLLLALLDTNAQGTASNLKQ
jgi:hypothetical protein